MNKSQLADMVALETGLSKVAARRAMEAAFNSIVLALKEGERVSVSGFGTFVRHQQAARNGRNPRTGAVVKIPSRTVIKFRPSVSLEDRPCRYEKTIAAESVTKTEFSRNGFIKEPINRRISSAWRQNANIMCSRMNTRIPPT